jgi:hypothetical protein
LDKASCPTASRTRKDLLQAKNSNTGKQQQNTNNKLKNQQYREKLIAKQPNPTSAGALKLV